MTRHLAFRGRVVRCAAAALMALATGCDRDEVLLPAEPPPVEPRTDLNYVLARTLDSGMAQLNGLALDAGGDLYLAGSDGVRVLDAGGEEVRAFPIPEAAHCVAVAEDGTVYVGLATRVEKYSPAGRLLASWGDGSDADVRFKYITDVAVSGPDVYVADAGSRRVFRFDTTGDLIGEIGAPDPDEGVPGLLCPSAHLDCVVGPEGLLFINNPGRRRVERYRPDGKLLDWWGTQGLAPESFCGCCNPTDIALAPDGRIVTAEKGIPRVKLYDPTGRMLAFIGPRHFSRDAKGLDVAVGATGRIYVADPGDGKVRVFEPVEPSADVEEMENDE